MYVFHNPPTKMDFSNEQSPEEKKINVGKIIQTAGKVIHAAAPFVPVLQPIDAVITAVKK